MFSKISLPSGFSALRCKYTDEWTYLVLLFLKLPGNTREIVWVVYLFCPFSWYIFFSPTDSQILYYRLWFPMIRKDADTRYYCGKQKLRFYSSAWDTLKINSLQQSRTQSYSCTVEDSSEFCTSMPSFFVAKTYVFFFFKSSDISEKVQNLNVSYSLHDHESKIKT